MPVQVVESILPVIGLEEEKEEEPRTWMMEGEPNNTEDASPTQMVQSGLGELELKKGRINHCTP